MVASHPLGPGKFYGSSLPRPYLYTDVKHSSERVDPPAPLMDPLLSWARDAHWSMGGLSHTRLRLQGRIEGSVKRLRAQHERQFLNHTPAHKSALESPKVSPRAPLVMKRKRFTVLVDEEDVEDRETVVKGGERKKLARRLREDFDRVADKSPEKSPNEVRVSPRLTKRGSSL